MFTFEQCFELYINDFNSLLIIIYCISFQHLCQYFYYNYFLKIYFMSFYENLLHKNKYNVRSILTQFQFIVNQSISKKKLKLNNIAIIMYV